MKDNQADLRKCLYFTFLIFLLKILMSSHLNFSDFFFYQEIGFDILCKLSPKEIICIKYQTVFSVREKYEKYMYFKMLSTEIFTRYAKCQANDRMVDLFTFIFVVFSRFCR